MKENVPITDPVWMVDQNWMQKTGGYARDMTLRDHYAGLAMQYMGLPTRVHATGRIGDNSWSLEEMKKGFPYEDMSTVAYKWADAMLKAREGK
jgi:hypothetical protein